MTDENNIKPLSTDDLRANASNWTLAGDVGLLAHLEDFSKKIFQKAETTENALNNLLDSVEEVSTNFSNVNNQFQSLHNSQFLENRVYDDETPTEDHNPPVVKTEDETRQQVVTKYKNAVVDGLKLLDTHFEKVELPQSSDSEDESSDRGSSLLLKPKVAYTKPLPLIIGSAEWWADDTVGLGEFLENDESEPHFSNSESPANEIEKRLRLSSSSVSNSSEDVGEVQKQINTNLSDRLGSAIDEPDQLFAPVTMHKDKEDSSLFGGNSNLFKDDDDEDGLFDKLPPPNISHDASNIAVKVPQEYNKTPANKREDKIFFGEDEVDDSIFNSEKILPNPISSKVPNEFTKELLAKLGNVAKTQSEPKKLPNDEYNPGPSRLPPSKEVGESSEKSKLPPKVTPKNNIAPPKKEDNRLGEISSKKPALTGLFDNDPNFDDDDFLFGAKPTSGLTASSRPLALPSKLFDDEENDLSPIPPINRNKQETDENNESKNVKLLRGSLSSKPKSSNTYGDKLFPDDLEDDLFSAISKPAVSAVFPQVTVSKVDTNSPVYVEQPGLKSSTPAVGFSAPDDNLFDNISRLEKANSSGESEGSAYDSENLLEHPSNDDARIESVQYDSRDQGFIESSDISENQDSPANWFQPQFYSTRALAVETSGYKTGTMGPSVSSGVTSSSTENSSVDPINQKISSIAEESDLTSQQKQPQLNKSLVKDKAINDHLVPDQKNSSSVPDQDEPQDLFKYVTSASKIENVGKDKSSQQPKPVKPLSLFDDDEDDDLFSSKSTVNSKIVPDKPFSGLPQIQDNSKANIKPTSLFSDDVEDNVLFGDGSNKAQDNVSIASGRSSIFDEPTAGKSTLPSIFTAKPPSSSIMATSLFEDVDDDIDLFSNKTYSKSKKNESSTLKEEIEQNNSVGSKNLFTNKELNFTSSVVRSTDKQIDDDDDDLFSNKKRLDVGITKESINVSKKESSSKNDSSSLLVAKKPTPPSSLNIRKPINDLKTSHDIRNKKNIEEIDDIDLFSNKKSVQKLIKTESESAKISKELPKNEDAYKSDSTYSIVAKSHSPPPSLNATEQSGDGDNVKVAVTKKIGKLNIPSNLKINPSSLLPGAKLVKPTNIVADNVEDEVPLNRDSINAPAHNFESGPQSNETSLPVSDHILPTSLKDRVRISVKRRPQSRRARQDALRYSGIDFSPTEDSPSISPSSAPFSTPPQNIVSPSTDEEDFHVPELDLTNEKDDHNSFNDVLSKREVTHTIDDALLFNSAPVISPTEDKSGKKSTINKSSSSGGKSIGLFQTSDDDLFSSVKPVTTKTPSNKPNLLNSQKEEKKSKSTTSAIKTESLFDDVGDDDDDAIFSAKSTSTHTSKPSTVSKLPKDNFIDNVSQNFLDPLGLLKESKD